MQGSSGPTPSNARITSGVPRYISSMPSSGSVSPSRESVTERLVMNWTPLALIALITSSGPAQAQEEGERNVLLAQSHYLGGLRPAAHQRRLREGKNANPLQQPIAAHRSGDDQPRRADLGQGDAPGHLSQALRRNALDKGR